MMMMIVLLYVFLWWTIKFGFAEKNILDLGFSTKTAYANRRGISPPPTLKKEWWTAYKNCSSCRVVHVSYVIRHGTRNPSPKDINRINNLASSLRKSSSTKIPTWLRNNESYNISSANHLVPAGESELISLGSRVREVYASDLPPSHSPTTYYFQHTFKIRTAQSASAFAYGFFNGFQPIKYDYLPAKTSPVLRFFDSCPLYKTSVAKNHSAMIEFHSFLSSATMLRHTASLNARLNTSFLTPQDVVSAYTACSFDVAVHNVTTQWCTLFSTKELESMDYYKDLKAYWGKAHGFDLSINIATPLLEHVLNVITTRQYVGYFSFAHAETLLPLICLLRLIRKPNVAPTAASSSSSNKREFKASNIVPFAANVGFIVLRNESDEEFVIVTLNEEPVALPDCTLLCPLDSFKTIVSSFLWKDFDTKCTTATPQSF